MCTLSGVKMPRNGAQVKSMLVYRVSNVITPTLEHLCPALEFSSFFITDHDLAMDAVEDRMLIPVAYV